MKNFLERLARSNDQSLAHDGSLMVQGNLFMRLYKKFRKEFIGAVLIFFLIPTIVYARYGGENGMIFSLVVFSLIGLLGLGEVMNNFSVSRFGQLVIILMFLWAVFTPFDLLIKLQKIANEGNGVTTWGFIPYFHEAYPWYTFITFGVSSLVFIFDRQKDMPTSYQVKRFFFILSSLFLTTGMVKTIFILSIGWTHILVLYFSIVVLVDSFSSIGGKLFGKMIPWKLAPKISPNKTVIGAVIGSSIASGVYLTVSYTTDIWDPYFVDGINRDFWIIFAGVSIPTLSIFGDLFFSSMKRLLGVKDFSSLISGHGGIYDRMDSHALMFSTAGYLYMLYYHLYIGLL